ncbi:MAG: NmrA family NAD(P)-binding protein [Actinocrinis sp.]
MTTASTAATGPTAENTATAVIGATGRVGSKVVRLLLERGTTVRALVRNTEKARTLFGDAPGLEIVSPRLDDPAAVAAALTGADTAFVAMGSAGLEGNLQRVVIQAAAATPGLRQFVRLSVLNAGPDSFGLNQRGHWDIDFAAQLAGLPYSTIRPSIFSASLLIAAPEVRASRTWTGLADTGRVALSDDRDAAEAVVRVLTDPATWGRHHDLTGPRLVSWPQALEALSAELGEKVTFRAVDAFELVRRLVSLGVAPGQAQLLVTREWAILAGENERTTTTVEQLTGHAPRTVEDYLHEHREVFV